MDFLKSIFGDKALTYTELEAALKDNKEIKLGNLATGQYVDKVKLDAKIGELNTANQTIKDLQDAVKKFDGVDIEKLKNDAADWERKYNSDTAKIRMDSALDYALLSGKAKNPKLVKAALDPEKIKLDGDKLLGLDEQLEALKKSDPYLFDEETAGGKSSAKIDSGKGHEKELGGDDDAKLRAAFGLPL
jgi:hypothetical protein